MASKPNRTSSGSPSQAARNKYGDQSGGYPVFDHKSAMAAINLRGHADDPAKILDKVSRYANSHDDTAAKKAVSKARKVDRQK